MRTMVEALCLSLLLMVPTVAVAGPAEEANAIVDRWSAAYNSNDPDAVVRMYAPDAILLGTVSPVISKGAEEIRKYFAMIKGSGNKNTIEERYTIPVSDTAVVVTGFYGFTRMKDGQPTPSPSRFTMLLMKRDGEWRIAHHHSSPHEQPK